MTITLFSFKLDRCMLLDLFYGLIAFSVRSLAGLWWWSGAQLSSRLLAFTVGDYVT